MSGVAVMLAVLVAALAAGAGVAPALLAPRRDPGAAPAARPGQLGAAARPSRRAADDRAVAAWCERVAAGVRSGSSLTRAVLDADEPATTPPFPHVVRALRRGRPLAEACRDAADGPSTPAGLVAPVVASCAELGGPAAAALERVAAVLLARADERDERLAASAQARLSCRVLTVVPLGVVGFVALTEPSIRAALATPAGLLCLAAGGALDALGWWWMRRLIGAAS